ncbi:hypothetical protein HIM_05800 [Hirsutella minnesotensis 3608]|uniref:Carrier domain-containing protein n=1 Tax=Hirsutella minnesotensis 3608 TaxID=1043627 RepID=A0A0F7ZK19_9HYPO|nr:hypothetical protein HIM_05800 [Hirsutella minnesotensis 3608]
MRAYVFPGQATRLRKVPSIVVQQNHHVRHLFSEAREVFGIDFTTIDLQDELETRSKDTALAQPLIFLASMADYLQLPPEQSPAMMAGHSLGQIVALTASGALTFRTALELVLVRGMYMQQTCDAKKSGMLAVVGLSQDEVRLVCDSWNIENKHGDHLVIANYNSPRQFVISGSENSLQYATYKLTSAERLIRLASPGAFHSQHMFEANEKFKDHVLATSIAKPKVPVYMNTSARCSTEPSEIREELLHHMVSPVQWIATVQNMVMDGASEFLQVSTGSVLRKLIQQIDSSVAVSSIPAYGNQIDMESLSADEKVMRDIWIECLPALAHTSLSEEANFFECGADSVDVMRLSSAARRKGFRLTIETINKFPNLSKMALALERCSVASNEKWAPEAFSLLPSGLNLDTTKSQVAGLCGIPESDIEDMMSCSPFQEASMALTCKRKGIYVTRKAVRIAPGVDIEKLRSAWSFVVEQTPILRTRIVHLLNGHFLQVICRRECIWSEDREDQVPMGLGVWLMRLELEGQLRQGIGQLIITIHHAVFDAWSLHLVLETVSSVYLAQSLPEQLPFSRFIAYLKDNQAEAATSHWEKYLEDLDAPQFPKLPISMHQSHADGCSVLDVQDMSWNRKLVTPSNTVRAAFALLLSRLSGSNDIIFGSTVLGRQLEDFAGAENVAGPMIATVPARALVDMDMTTADFLETVQQQTQACMPFMHLGLSRISKINETARAACDFQSLLVVQHLPRRQRSSQVFPNGVQNAAATKTAMGNFDKYALIVEVTVTNDSFNLHVQYDQAVMDKAAVDRITHQFEHIIRQLNNPLQERLRLSEISWTCQRDVDQILTLNRPEFPLVEACVHELFAEKAAERTLAPAVCAWNGSLNFRELDDLSSRLAQRLVSCGIGTIHKGFLAVLPLYFEKGVWAVVTALAVVKAGGAGCFFDASLPEDRLNSIASQLNPALVLSSRERFEEAQKAWHGKAKVLLVDRDFLDTLPLVPAGCDLPRVDPWGVFCALFTSGSTGKPKGLTLSHAQLCSAIKYHADTFKWSETTRYYDFAAQAFDLSWIGITEVLCSGGCLCIPSEAERRDDVAGSFARYGCNATLTTPSVARTLVPESMPGLKTLILGGEAVTGNDVARWNGFPDLVSVYGPAECVFLSTAIDLNAKLMNLEDDTEFPTGILGSARGAAVWLVDLSGTQLAPLGGLGEIWIEGPKVGAGYFGNEEATRQAFHDDPAWLSQDVRNRLGRKLLRFYKTGDYARYDSHGRLVFMGRRDLQVKINGQRIELDEIQLRAEQALTTPNSKSSALRQIRLHVNVVTPCNHANSILVVFIASTTDDEQELKRRSPDDTLTEAAVLITRNLRRRFPDFMVPNLFVPVNTIPISATGKTDQRLLREFGSSLSLEELIQGNPLRNERTAPHTEAEIALSKLWAEVLQLDPQVISAQDSFYQLGGDSIAAMRLVALARSRCMIMTALAIMQNPLLCDQALELKMGGDGRKEALPVPPFSLLDSSVAENLEETVARGAAMCRVQRSAVEDMFPCTPLQEAFMAATIREPTKYVGKLVYELDDAVDCPSLIRAFGEAQSEIDVLRSRIIDVGGAGLTQVILSAACPMAEWSSLEEYRKAEKPAFGLATALVRLDLIHPPVESNRRRYLILSVHHAVYDGWSLPLIIDRVASRYRAAEQPLRPAASYKTFVKYIQDIDAEAARNFWREHLENAEATIFPQVPRPAYEPLKQDTFSQHVADITWPRAETGITVKTLLTTAWAAVASRYSDSEHVVFGTISNGRLAPLGDVENIAGLAIATTPIHVHIPPTENLSNVLHKVQETSSAIIAYEQVGIRTIKGYSVQTEQLCQFQTLLVVHPVADDDTASRYDDLLVRCNEQDDVVREFGHDSGNFGSHVLSIQVLLDTNGYTVKVAHDPDVLGQVAARRLMRQFGAVLRQVVSSLTAGQDVTIEQLSLDNEEDIRQIWKWNEHAPAQIQGRVHDLVHEAAIMYPDSPALCSWEGEMTHRQLDELSTRLAIHLAQVGVRPGVIVPLCFEKSLWTVVSIMGVMKAGGASVIMDVGQPVERLRQIVAKVNPVVVLCSANWKNLAMDSISPLASKPFIQPISADLVENLHLDRNAAPVFPYIDPSSPLYVVFTSGSTGEPKGAVISHANFCSAIEYQRGPMRYHPGSRVFDFVSYAFDVTWPNILQTLTVGGCVCVPSEDERKNDINASIRRLEANAIHVPTSVARLVDPTSLADIKTVVMGGEPVALSDVQRWGPGVEVIQVYGPAECTPPIMASYNVHTEASMKNIGHGYGIVPWIVDPQDCQRLSPVGVEGELVVEGPLIGLGYLNEPQKTAAAFIENPRWLVQGSPTHAGRHGRVYRTGDLARYDQDGSIIFVGRRDSQVKIRGQRVELGEVEIHITRLLQCHNRSADVVVDVVRPKDSTIIVLVAFVAIGSAAAGAKEEAVAALCDIVAALSGLSTILPIYMVPTAYLPVEHLPVGGTGKVDRRCLRGIGASLTMEQLTSYNPDREVKRQPSTEWELNVDSIGADDSFLRLGGDSITAIRLVELARKKYNLAIKVSDIFTSPRLSDLARLASGRIDEGEVDNSQNDVEPFVLLGDNVDIDRVRALAAEGLRLSESLIEDVYPCTALQEGLLASTSLVSNTYVASSRYNIEPAVDLCRLRRAWDILVSQTPILRTRIIELPEHGLVQVVLGHDSQQWVEGDACSRDVGLGLPLLRCGIARLSSGETQFWWRMHHAIYDGVSLRLLVDNLCNAYENGILPTMTPFNRFIAYVDRTCGTQDLSKGAIDFWKSQLEGPTVRPFPDLPTPSYRPWSNEIYKRHIEGITWQKSSFTASNILRAVWALLSARYTASENTIFGVVVSGRQAPLTGIETLVGPTIATVPVLVSVAENFTVMAFLEQVQSQAVDMIRFEQTRLRRIRQISTDLDRQSRFNTLLICHQESEDDDAGLNCSLWRDVSPGDATGTSKQTSQSAAFNSFAVLLQCTIVRGGVHLKFDFDSAVVSRHAVEWMAEHFESGLRQMLAADLSSVMVKDISFLCRRDLDTMWSMNSSIPAPVDRCIHDLVRDISTAWPDRMAIDSHDGQLTYQELEKATDSFAKLLVAKGVRPGGIVPILSEKSLWTSVAALGTMKAGAVAVLLDTFLPIERLRTTIKQVQPALTVSSVDAFDLVDHLGIAENIVLSKDILMDGIFEMADILPRVSSSDIAYIVFTSGSTGTPKGIMIRHSNMTSSIQYQNKALGFAETARVFDFASYSFDVCWSNMLQTLAAGACLCVPSESERRNDLQGSLVRYRIDAVELTPTVARTLDVDSLSTALPGLKLLHLGGEAVTKDDLHTWLKVPNLNVINVYGPAEATPTTVAHAFAERDIHEPVIGSGLGVCCWVVDISDGNRLAPVGTIGELWLEGPLVGAGYLNDPEKTVASFVKDPPWLASGYRSSQCSVPGRSATMYRTGDLVKLSTDGQLVYVGRMDGQVKINGQRTELNEIETIARENLPRGSPINVVMDLLQSPGKNESTSKKVVAFLASSLTVEKQKPWLRRALVEAAVELDKALALVLPRYMIPSVFLAIDKIPLGATGKTDRRQLREMAQSMSKEAWNDADLLHSRQSDDGTGATAAFVPQTPTEKLLRQLWAKMLSLNAEHIGRNDSFFRLGGDSVLAMRLVGLARFHNIKLDVSQIFRHAELRTLGAAVDEAQGMISTNGINQNGNQDVYENEQLPPPPPFSLLNLDHAGLDRTLREAASAVGVSVDHIQDMYPCTALQEGFLAITEQQPAKYIALYNYQLPAHVDVGRFKAAWQAVAAQMPILRTRFAELDGLGIAQIVLETGIEFVEYEDWDTRSKLQSQLPKYGLGAIAARYEIVLPPANSTRGPVFIWTLHHCLYDGWSLPMYLDAVRRAYHDPEFVSRSKPFNVFIRHISPADRQASDNFWRRELESSQAVAFPKLPSVSYQANPTSKHIHSVHGVSLRNKDFTAATYLQAAWSLLVSRHSNSEDIIFGSLSSGRQASLAGVTQVAGPTVAVVPVRTAVNGAQTVSQFLQEILDHNVALIQFEQTGLQTIRRIGGKLDTKSAFNTLLVMQLDMEGARKGCRDTKNQLFGNILNAYASEQAQQATQISKVLVDEFAFSTYAMSILFTILQDGVRFEFSFDEQVIESDFVRRMSLQLETLLRQLCAKELENATLATLSATSVCDLEDIWSWNAVVPPDVSKCIHKMIIENMIAKDLRGSLAIQAHDGQCTYGELDDMSDKLAEALLAVGQGEIGPNVVVPLLFEKSKWTVISILAVWKTGAAVLCLDDNLQDEQIRGMIERVSPSFVVSSSGRAQRCRRILDMNPKMGLSITVVDAAFISSLSIPGHDVAVQPREKPAVQPADLLYINFTSGSTGQPKGVMVRHRNLAAATTYQAEAFGFSEKSRVYDFCAYAFDITWLNLIFTLTVGGCLCIPTDDQRKDDLVRSFRWLGANHVNLTPSVSRTVDPSSMVGLKTLGLCGEPVLGTDAAQWLKKGPQKRLINTYGPSECTPAATAHILSDEDVTAAATRFGVGLGLNTWLVEPDGSRLAAVGSVGELWLEGPLVSAGYLNDPVKSATSFVENPKWLAEGAPGHAGRGGRLYRTGDLVRYNTDGTLSYVSRVDTQVKIGGHRVGLAEIEFVAQQILDGVTLPGKTETQMQVTVDLVRPAGGETKLLVAFIAAQPDGRSQSASLKQRVVDWLRNSEFREMIAKQLPSALVPRVWIPVEGMPVDNSAKVDRRKLSTSLQSMTIDEVLELDHANAPAAAVKRPPETENEAELILIWSKVLSIAEENIGIDDSFIQLGGDSILAMKVV